ncbi:MAG: hypothetical protein MRY83_09045 [Flavobacteriales bacterium]|nr:hypothetical protein [Flavobacteriales bacterium]
MIDHFIDFLDKYKLIWIVLVLGSFWIRVILNMIIYRKMYNVKIDWNEFPPSQKKYDFVMGSMFKFFWKIKGNVNYKSLKRTSNFLSFLFIPLFLFGMILGMIKDS